MRNCIDLPFINTLASTIMYGISSIVKVVHLKRARNRLITVEECHGR